MTTFLDVLPKDLYELIAYYLFSSVKCDQYDYIKGRFGLIDDQDLNTLLEYAKNSSDHLNAVMRAMSHSLLITENWREDTVMGWISATATELQELNMLEARRFSFPGQAPGLSKLRKATITVATEQLLLIRDCPNLSDLTVNITDTNGWDNFVSTIASLPVKTLNLYFATFQENGNTRSYLENLSRSDLMQLVATCSNVENFHLNPAGKQITAEAWDMIRELPCLKTLTLRGRDIGTEGDHGSFIDNIPQIEIHVSSGIAQAQRFGSAVRLLEISFPSSEEQLMDLKLLPNLQKLRLVLHPGAESALIGNIENVEVLYLSWTFAFDSYPAGNFQGNPQNLMYPVYHEPDIGILESILKRTKHLKNLKIAEAILSSDAIERCLTIVGEKLEDLELCHDWQNEAVSKRMERIFKAVTRYCPRLTILRFIENTFPARYFIMSTENQKSRCLRALQQLVTARPGFRSYRILRNIIENRFIHEHPVNVVMLWEDILPN